MTYSLEFDARALKEWQKLGDVRQQLEKKFAEILLNPRIEANRFHSLPDCYKIKLAAVVDFGQAAGQAMLPVDLAQQ